MRSCRRFQVLLVSVLLTLCNVVCADAAQIPSRKVVLQLRWDHQFQFAGYYAAKWQGYYQEAGLDVEIRSAITPDGRILKAVDEVREKRANFGIGGSDILAANSRFGDFVVLASIFQSSAARIYALKSAQLSKPGDLAGKRVARNKGDLIDVEMQVMLKAEGIDQSKLVSVPHSPSIEELKRGEIDVMPGYSISLPYEARMAGLELSSLNPSTYGVDFYGDSLFSLNSWANENSKLVESFVSASLRGWEYALTHPDEIIERIATELPRAVPIGNAAAFNRFQAQGVKQLAMYPAVELGHINPGRWERMHKSLRDAGLMSDSLDIASFIYDGPHRAASKISKLQTMIATIAAVTSVVFAVIVLWTAMLRRQVRTKTQALMESQRTLRESEEKFSRIFAYDPLPKAVTRIETGEFLEVNDRFMKVLGYSLEELIGNTSVGLGIITPEKRSQVLDLALLRGRLDDLELQLIDRNGNAVDVLYYAEVLTLNGEQRLLSTFQDITPRKLAEEQLIREKRFADDVIDSIQDIFYASDLNGRMMRWNSKLTRISGYTNDEIAGMSFGSFFVGDDVKRVSEAIKMAVEVEYTSFEAKLVCKDGTAIIHEFHGSILLDSQGQSIGICGVGRDISERKQLELFREANQKTMELLLTVIDTGEALHGVVSLLQSSLGFDAVGIRLQSGDDFPYLAEQGFPPEFLAKENSLVLRSEDGGVLLEEQGMVRLECTCGLVLTGTTDPCNPLITKRGSFWTNDSTSLLDLPREHDPRLNPRNECIHKQYASIALVPIRTNSNSIIGLLQLNDRRKGRFTHDIMAELENVAAHIGERIVRGMVIDEKNALQDQLNQSQKMEAIGQLAGGIAHDFNNILTVITGYCKLLFMGSSLSKEQKMYLSEIEASAERAAQLTHGLLAFSRKQFLAMRHENLNDIIQHVHKFLARVIGEDITFNSTCCGQELPVVADQGQIEQILINLAANARDAMKEGGVFTIKSELVVLDSSVKIRKDNVLPGKYALLTVSDTGTGIKKEHIDHIFEPFFTTKEVGKGTGLGMAIVYGIVKQHNGFINVHSEPGQGTTFQIYLPIQEANGRPQEDTAEAKPLSGGNETILVVEDDPPVRSLVSQILTSYGYETILAEDGEDAIDKFTANRERIALVLMDIIMPNKNGREAFEEIKRIRPGTKALFSSGYTADFIESRGGAEDGIELIMKPVQPTELLRRVRELLDR